MVFGPAVTGRIGGSREVAAIVLTHFFFSFFVYYYVNKLKKGVNATSRPSVRRGRGQFYFK